MATADQHGRPVTEGLPIEAVRSVFADLVGVVLFGSEARGRAREHSDIDLLLVLPPDRDLHRGLYDVWDTELQTVDRRITPHFARLPVDPSSVGGLWREVAQEGVVLWERDEAVSAAMQAIRDHVQRAGDHRELLHGHPYWVRGR